MLTILWPLALSVVSARPRPRRESASLFRLERRRATAAITRIFARPHDLPAACLPEGQAAARERDSKCKSRPKIDEQQTIVVRPRRKSAARTLRAEHRAIDPPRRWARKTDPRAADCSRSRCKLIRFSVLARVRRDRACSARTFQDPPDRADELASPGSQAWETGRGIRRDPADTSFASSVLVVGEEEKRTRGGEFLPLEQHRRCRAQAASTPSSPGSGQGWSDDGSAGPSRSSRPDRDSGGRSRTSRASARVPGVPRRCFCQVYHGPGRGSPI